MSTLTEDDVRRIAREEIAHHAHSTHGGSLRDMAQLIEAGIDPFDSLSDGKQVRLGLVQPTTDGELPALQSGVRKIEGGVQVVGDLAHGQSVPGTSTDGEAHS